MKKLFLSLVLLFSSISLVFADPSTEKCLASVRILKECADFGAKYGVKNCKKYSSLVSSAFCLVGDSSKIKADVLNKFVDTCEYYCMNSQKFYQIQNKKIEECKTGTFSAQDIKVFNYVR